MYQPIALFIGLRYVRGRVADYFDRFVSWLAAIGIALGVMAIVIAISIMNGFERDLQYNILELMPQAVLFSSTGSISPQQLPKKEIKLRGVNRIAPLTTGDVILQSTHSVSTGIMLGIDPVQSDPLAQYLVKVRQDDLKPGKYNIVLGEQLAKQLDVNQGDQLRVIVPSVSRFTPMGLLPSQRLFNVIGTFAVNSEVNSYQILVNIQDASYLMQYPKGNITGWRLWLNDPLKVADLNHQKLPKGTRLQDWRDRKGELFQAVHIEKNIMVLLLSLIIAVAAFNIITSLGLMVIERRGEIAILQTQGLAPRQIIAIFIIQGVSTSTIGALIGTVLGLLLVSQLNNFMPIINILINSATTLPINIELLNIIDILLIVMIITLLSILYPSWYAASIQPVEALRYE